MKALALAIALGAGLALAGCAPSPSTPTDTPTSSDSPTATATPTSTPTPEYDIGPEGGCDPRQLEIALTSRPHDSGMSQFYWQLEFTNVSDVECNLEGNPTIAEIDASGAQVGPLAGYEYVNGSGTVPMPAGATAYSIIHFTVAAVHDCPLADVSSIRVTIPHRDDSTAVDLATPNAIQACTSDQVTANSGSITATERPG